MQSLLTREELLLISPAIVLFGAALVQVIREDIKRRTHVYSVFFKNSGEWRQVSFRLSYKKAIRYILESMYASPKGQWQIRKNDEICLTVVGEEDAWKHVSDQQ